MSLEPVLVVNLGVVRESVLVIIYIYIYIDVYKWHHSVALGLTVMHQTQDLRVSNQPLPWQ